MRNKITEGIAYLKKRVVWLWLAAIAPAYLIVWALPRVWGLGEPLSYTNSIFSFFLFLLLACLFHKAGVRLLGAGTADKAGSGFQKEAADFGAERYVRWLPFLIGISFSVCMVFGYELDRKGSVSFLNGSVWAVILLLTLAVTLTVGYLWRRLAKRGLGWKQRYGEMEKSSGTGKRTGDRFVPWRYALVIFLLYLPSFLAVYPGFFVYDAQEELMQVITRNFSTHHPLLHVLLLGGIIQLIHKLTGSYNLGIACYILLQMGVLAGIFGWCIWKCRLRGLGKWGCRLFTVYFGLFPVLVMFSLCSAKDGLFTGMLLMLVIQLRQLCTEPETFFTSFKNMALLGASALGMLLLRHNAFYAFLAYAVILAVFIGREMKKERRENRLAIWRKRGKWVLLYLPVILAVYFGINLLLTSVLQADDSEHQEMLTVPISQFARVYAYEREGVSPEDAEILYRYLSEDALMRYTPKVADGVKLWFNNEAYELDAGSFWRLWGKWGRKHPFAYLNAWFMTSYGFWYPDTVIDVYRGNTVFTYTYEDSSYFGYEVEQPGERESKIPWLDEFYRKISLEITQQKIPVVSMLFSPGFLFWVMVFGLGYLGYVGRWRKVLPYGIALLVWMTFLLGPTYLVRYVVFLWAVVPLLVQDIWINK